MRHLRYGFFSLMYTSILSSFKQQCTLRVSSDLKSTMLSGKFTRFLQYDKSRLLRAVRCPIEDGSSFIAVSFKLRNLRAFRCPIEDGSSFISVSPKSSRVSLLIFPWTSGKLFSFEQPEQYRRWRCFNLWKLLGRLSSLSHPINYIQENY